MSAAEERLANDPTSELWGEHRSRYRFAIELVSAELGQGGTLAGHTILDVACGAGFGVEMLRTADASVLGIDYDATTLREVRRSQPASRLVHADATRLPLQDASVDGVVSFETIEHVPDARALVLEIRRVLKPGGRLVLSTPNRAFGPPERHTGNPFHVREFTADELREVLRASFQQVRLFGQRPAPAYRYVPFLMVQAHTEPAALAWKLLVRLPFELRNRLALALSGRPFFPGEDDYRFVADGYDGAHALVAVAR
jgi:ubiquinone/menaquinone biosynthesis C-methylase UbiE